MIVKVEIDLAKDRELMMRSSNDPSIAAMLDIHNSLSDDESQTYLEMIGQHLWNGSKFVATLVELCGDDLYDFKQSQAFLFEFDTSDESAFLFRTGCHAPQAISIIPPRKIPPDVIFRLT